MSVLGMSLAASVSTAVGGLLAFAWRDRLHRLLAFSAGTLLGVLGGHLLPESIELAKGSRWAWPMAGLAMLAGLGSLHAIDRWSHRHGAHGARGDAGHTAAAALAPAAVLVGHSGMDGAAIGFAFQASTTVGVGVALAVVAHDLCDGMNTVGLMLARRRGRRATMGMLALNAVAPTLGAVAAALVPAPPAALSLAMAYIAGCLLHIIAADLLPRLFAGGVAATHWRTPVLIGCGLAFAVIVPRGAA
jgi:ZIP family zinc transporter